MHILHDSESCRAWRDSLRQRGLRLVVTNGCFDILHVGHVRYLEQARALGDTLLVLVNGDASVRTLKGPTRPINAEHDRAEVLASLRCVDAVRLFYSPRCDEMLREIAPDIYAKGGDYTLDTLDPGERDALLACGARLEILPLVPGKSTSAVIAKMAEK